MSTGPYRTEVQAVGLPALVALGVGKEKKEVDNALRVSPAKVELPETAG